MKQVYKPDAAEFSRISSLPVMRIGRDQIVHYEDNKRYFLDEYDGTVESWEEVRHPWMEAAARDIFEIYGVPHHLQGDAGGGAVGRVIAILAKHAPPSNEP